MNVARNVAEVLTKHTTLELECIDRMYLNVYVPMLQSGAGAAHFFRKVRGNPVPSSALMAPMTRAFVQAIKGYAQREGIDLIRFERFERKDERTQAYLRDFTANEGVLYIGKAQEKARVVRTERRHDPVFGPYPWLVSSTAMVNHYYIYIVDEDFGPLFIKFCSYFPYNAKLCLNGHEYLKRQLAKRGIAFEALDNGIASCADPAMMQHLADGLTAPTIDRLVLRGFSACRIRSRRATAPPASATTSLCCRRSSLSPRSSIGPFKGGSSSRRFCARTSIWAVPTTFS